MLYIKELKDHYERYFGLAGTPRVLKRGPKEKLHPDFYILEFAPNEIHSFWAYCTVGMSIDRNHHNLIELFVFSPSQDESHIELLTVCASYHRNSLPLDLHHTVNIGRPILPESKCDHAFISLPYLDGEDLELFSFNERIIHCYWLIPITVTERNYKIDKGSEALEQLFEDKHLNYLDPLRKCLLTE